MQHWTANAQTIAFGKAGFGRRSILHEADTMKRKAVTDGRGDSETGERRHAVGHQALAARLVDRRLRAIGDDHLEAAPACRDSRGESSGSAADHENVGFTRQLVHRLTTGRESSPNRTPDPSPAIRQAFRARAGAALSRLPAPAGPKPKTGCRSAAGIPTTDRARHRRVPARPE